MPASVTTEVVSGKTIHWGSSAPLTPIVIKGFAVTQKGREFYFVKGKGLDIDRLCKVPVLPYSLDNCQIARLVLSPDAGNWQRELDVERIEEIKSFFVGPANFIVNTAVISLLLRPDQIHRVDEQVEIIISPDWMVDRCPQCSYVPSSSDAHFGKKFDSCPQCDWDGRPGLLIDGQHRIRGVGASTLANESILTTILSSAVFSTSDMAKIFTEITTTAVDLDHLHKIYLLYKFSIRGINIGVLRDADFRTNPPTPGSQNSLGMRNRRAYEAVAELCQLTNSRWHDRITMLPFSSGKARRADVIDADRLVSYLELWLKDGELKDVSQPDGMAIKNDAVRYLQDYLEAALSIWPKGAGTPPGSTTPIWVETRTSTGYVQQRGIFEVFVQLFPMLTRRMKMLHIPITREAYRDQWLYIEELDWTVPGWNSLTSPGKNKDMLFQILEHFYNTAPNPIGSARMHSVINTWIKGQPDDFKFIQTPSATLPVGKASRSTALVFKWESTCAVTGKTASRPVNAWGTATVFVSQHQAGQKRILETKEVSGSEFRLTEPPPGLDTSPRASNVDFEVVYENAVQNRSIFSSHPAA